MPPLKRKARVKPHRGIAGASAKDDVEPIIKARKRVDIIEDKRRRCYDECTGKKPGRPQLQTKAIKGFKRKAPDGHCWMTFKQAQEVLKKGGEPILPPINGGRQAGVKPLSVTLNQYLIEPASRVPVIAAMAMEMGLHPSYTRIGGVLVAMMVKEALEGNSVLMKEIFERVEGKVTEMVEARITSLSDLIREKAAVEEVNAMPDGED